jgi:YfiH family protein
MLLHSTLLTEMGFPHAFPTRDTTDAALHEALGVARVVQVKQVHGARAVDVEEAATAEADAIIARAASSRAPAERLAVGVRVADCVPILVGDVETGDVAAIHAGWRGVVAGVVGAGVGMLGGRLGLVAAIGPCIEACCFEVGPEVAERTGFVVRSDGEKSFVDLRAAVREELRQAGLRDACIDDVPGCTKHTAEFHSFRRDGANSGRMLAAIATAAAPGRGRHSPPLAR